MLEQPIIEVPQVAENLPEDQQVQELPHNLEQTVEPQAPQGEDCETPRKFQFFEKGQNRNFGKNLKIFYISDEKTDFTVGIVSRNLATTSIFV